MNKLTISIILEICTSCWCVPEEGPEGQCPALENRRLSYGEDIIKTFMSFSLALTPFEELPHLVPDDGTPINVSTPSCTPYPSLKSILRRPLCKTPQSEEGSVCAFFYGDIVKKNDLCAHRKYGMKTYKSYSEAVTNNAVVTHEEGMFSYSTLSIKA